MLSASPSIKAYGKVMRRMNKDLRVNDKLLTTGNSADYRSDLIIIILHHTHPAKAQVRSMTCTYSQSVTLSNR